MEPRTIQFIAESCGGTTSFLSGEKLVRRICTDSRAVEPGDLFVALTGEKFDGHDFVQEVFRKGALGAVVRANYQTNVPSIRVTDTRAALGHVAARYRTDFHLHSVAVAGSNGKTSTKELIGAVLRERFSTVSSAGSFNNDIGVPLSLLRIESEHEAGVFEAGTNHPGELLPLLEMIQPGIGVITSIGREHLEFFGDLDGVLREEGALADVLSDRHILIIHGDGYGADDLQRRARARVIRVGFSPGNDWKIVSAHSDQSGTHFNIRAPRDEFSGAYRMQLLGAHQALNATYAIVAGAELGLERGQIQAGLNRCSGAKMRLQLCRIDDFLVIDDAYNANADSMNAALETLGQFPCSGRRIAVLGDMGELGAATSAAHEEVGRCAAERRVDFLVTVGRNASVVAAAARNAGLREVAAVAEAEDAGPAVREIVRSGDVVLVKASRAARLERVIEYLAANFGVPAKGAS